MRLRRHLQLHSVGATGKLKPGDIKKLEAAQRDNKTSERCNTITGPRFEIVFGTNGQRLVTAMDGKAPDPAVMGDLMFDPETRYEIRDGHLVTYIDGTQFEATVYKSGDRYVASRSDEYGYANYEVELARQ